MVKPVPADAEPEARPYLSVVVPCCDEERVLPEIERRLFPIAELASGGSYEIVLVNDGSKDATWALMGAIARRQEHVVCVNLSRNFGHEIAATAGLEICRGERVLLLDGDLQDPPELLPEMMKILDAGADVAYGQRRVRAGESTFKRASAYMFYRVLSRFSEVRIPRDTGDFRLMSRRVVDAFIRMPESYRFVRGMVAWAGFRQEAILYDREPRFAGETKYSLTRMMKFAADAITGFSISPLRFAIIFSLVALLLSFASAAYAVISWLSHDVIEGWASTICIMSFFASVQMFCLALIGEYVGRTYIQSKNRPLYFVSDICTGAESARLRDGTDDLPKGSELADGTVDH